MNRYLAGKWMIMCLCILMMWVVTNKVVVNAEEQVVKVEKSQNFLENPGFEDIEPYMVPEVAFKDIMKDTTEMPKWWAINYGSYPGKLTVMYDPEVSHGGSKYILLERKDGEVALVYVGKWLKGEKTETKTGEKYSVSIWAKGKGNLAILGYGYADKAFKASQGSEYMEVSSEEWKEFKFDFTIAESITGVMLAFHVKGAVYLDDAFLSLIQN